MFTNVDRIQKWSPLPFLYSHACMISHSFGSDSCDPVNCSPPGFSIHGIILAEILAAAAKLLQSCPTLCNSVDGSPSGSPVSGILQARILEWVAIAFSNAWKWKVKVKSLSHVQLFATPWTAAYQAPPSMGFSRQEYGRGVPFPPSGDLPNPGIKPMFPVSPALQTNSLPLAPPGKP